QGFQDTHRTAERVASRLTAASRQPIGAVDVAVCSTGLIGELLPMDKLLPGVDAVVRGLTRDGGPAAAEAIMTTDTRPKTTVQAEGATKDVTIEIVGAGTEDDAVEVARSVARNNLVKCAFFGNDPNWGRILAAIGTTGAVFDPDDLDVAVNGVQVCLGGAAGD